MAQQLRSSGSQFSFQQPPLVGGLQLPSLQLSESQPLLKDIHTPSTFIHIHIKNKHILKGGFHLWSNEDNRVLHDHRREAGALGQTCNHPDSGQR